MKIVQTVAKQIAKNCENIGKYGCLAFCYLYCAGVDEDDGLEYLRIVSDCMDNEILGKDCTVLDATRFLAHITGRKYTVRKKNIEDIREIKEATPVRYGYNDVGHWVVVENGKIVYNSVLNSVCVAKGKPLEARILKKA